MRVDEDRGGESAGEAEDEWEEEPGLTRAHLHTLTLYLISCGRKNLALLGVDDDPEPVRRDGHDGQARHVDHCARQRFHQSARQTVQKNKKQIKFVLQENLLSKLSFSDIIAYFRSNKGF